MGQKIGFRHSQETKEKMRQNRLKNPVNFWLGKKLSDETIKKLSEYRTKNPICFWTGKKRPDISERLKGNKNHNWISDRSKLVKKQKRNDSAYFSWRREVFKRDSYKCKMSSINCSGKLEAHHILGWSLYPELRYNINNGITLCHVHHPRKKEDEKKLSPYFQSLVAEV